jgi:hypothetical protein
MAETAAQRTARLQAEARAARDRMQSEGFTRRQDYTVGQGQQGQPPAPPPPQPPVGIFDRIRKALGGG